MQSLNEEDQKPNPVVQRVKMIMIAGLFMVHANRYLYYLSISAIFFYFRIRSVIIQCACGYVARRKARKEVIVKPTST